MIRAAVRIGVHGLRARPAQSAALCQRTVFMEISVPARPFSSLKEQKKEPAGARTAEHAWQKSCYYNIDFFISEEEMVYEAVKLMSAHNVGCLIVTKDGKVNGLFTERDYVCKIALLGRSSKETKLRDVCTRGANMAVAKKSDSIETCVRKMLTADVRHLPVVEDATGEVFGLISVKDLVKEYTKEKDDMISKLFGGSLN